MPAPEPGVGVEGEEDGPPRTEVEQLQFRINQTTDDVGVSFTLTFTFTCLFIIELLTQCLHMFSFSNSLLNRLDV